MSSILNLLHERILRSNIMALTGAVDTPLVLDHEIKVENEQVTITFDYHPYTEKQEGALHALALASEFGTAGREVYDFVDQTGTVILGSVDTFLKSSELVLWREQYGEA